MAGTAVRLGIDFGTFTTVAVVAVGDQEPRPLLFDGSPLLRSAVCADSTGRLVVGRDALHLAMANPAGFEPHPKRCVDDGTVLLGDAEVPVEAVFARVLDRVVEEAARLGGGPPTEVVVTCPAGWGAERRAVLQRSAPLGAVLVPEPVAAAYAFARHAGVHVAQDGVALVYDLGAGTFDASVVRRTGAAFTVLATEGLSDTGGLDIDAALVDYMKSTVSPGDGAWARLTDPRDSGDRRVSRQLWDNIRTAKEMLSRSTTTLVHLPLLDRDVPLGREQLEQVAAPMLDRTIVTCREVLSAGGVGPAELAAVFLVGGTSRMPAIATALHRAFGVTASIVDQPELAVAMGSLLAARQSEAVGVEPDDAWPPFAPVAAAAPRRRRRTLMFTAAILAVLVAVVGAAYVAWPSVGSRPAGDGAAAATSSSAAVAPSASPSPSAQPGIDPCLVGSWRLVTTQVYGVLSGVRVLYTNGGGVIKVFRSDGTSGTDYNKSAPVVADFRGARWSVVFRGTDEAKYVAQDGVIRWSGVRAKGTAVLYRNGRVDTRGALEPNIEAENYFCEGDSYRASSSLGNYVSEFTRVAPIPSLR